MLVSHITRSSETKEKSLDDFYSPALAAEYDEDLSFESLNSIKLKMSQDNNNDLSDFE